MKNTNGKSYSQQHAYTSACEVSKGGFFIFRLSSMRYFTNRYLPLFTYLEQLQSIDMLLYMCTH